MKKCENCGYKKVYWKMFDFLFERIDEKTVRDRRTKEIIRIE